MFPTLSEYHIVQMPGQADSLGLSTQELQDWRTMEDRIQEWWEWFTGDKLKKTKRTTPGKDGEFPMLYPLQINPIRTACQLHSYALQGQVKDTSDPLVHSICEPIGRAGKGLADAASEAIETVAYENNARAMFTDMFLSSQSLGAIVVKVGWDPKLVQRNKTGVFWEYISPRYCFFRWGGTNYWDITEAWVRFNVSKETAAQYEIKTRANTVTYVEHWTPDKYSIQIAGDYISDGDGPINRRNPFGFVPFTYIPHERAGDFWGTSLVPGAIGMTKEINARMADMGDAVQKGVHQKIWGSNWMQGHPIEKELPDGTKVIYLGKTISASDPQPMLNRLEPPNMPAGYSQFMNDMEEMAQNAMITPSIAYGKEEGSQRSGQTLNQRMWPMLSHTTSERTNWTTGLNQICDMTIRILAAHGRAELTEKHMGQRWRQDWAPMVPMDRAALVMELIQRWQNNVISLELLLEKFGDIPDLKEEITRVQKLMADQQKLEVQQTAANKNISRNTPSERVEEG